MVEVTKEISAELLIPKTDIRNHYNGHKLKKCMSLEIYKN